MNKSSFALFSGILLVATVPVHASNVIPSAVAVNAIGQLSQEMRKKLVDSMQKNGPAGAINVCAMDAPAISTRIEQELAVSIKRTSLKIRNPKNNPDLAENKLLEALESCHKAGETLPAGVTVFPDNPRRFYKAIIMEQSCLKCHGDSTTMDNQVRKELVSLYPEDKAIGYNAGDFRGIISVLVKK